MNKNSKTLVIFVITPQFGTTEESGLIEDISKSMSVNGKQSKDRFIFVVNKCDDLEDEDGDTISILNRISSYLNNNHNIANPNLFPASAYGALNIRQIQNGVGIGANALIKTNTIVNILNSTENYHFDRYATLPSSIKDSIEADLKTAKINSDEYAQALIHTGVPSLEAAIRQYVQKYAKTAKIKNIVDTFIHKLDEVGGFEELKKKLAEECEKHSVECLKIAQQIDNIERKIDSAKEAKKFNDAVELAVENINNESNNVINHIIARFQAKFSNKTNEFYGVDIAVEDVEIEINDLTNFAKKLEKDFRTELNDLINDNLIATSNALLDEYKKKLISLTEEINISGISGVSIDPLKLMSGSVRYGNLSIQQLVKEKPVEDGREWVKNYDKKWYKPWTWFQEAGYYRTKYKTFRYINGSDFATEFFLPIEQTLYDSKDDAMQHASSQSNRIAEKFNNEFKKLDNVLKEKLSELQSYNTDQEKAEGRLKESKKRQAWLKQIHDKVNSLLEI